MRDLRIKFFEARQGLKELIETTVKDIIQKSGGKDIIFDGNHIMVNTKMFEDPEKDYTIKGIRMRKDKLYLLLMDMNPLGEDDYRETDLSDMISYDDVDIVSYFLDKQMYTLQ